MNSSLDELIAANRKPKNHPKVFNAFLFQGTYKKPHIKKVPAVQATSNRKSYIH